MGVSGGGGGGGGLSRGGGGGGDGQIVNGERLGIMVGAK